jgi:hypothetical protein
MYLLSALLVRGIRHMHSVTHKQFQPQLCTTFCAVKYDWTQTRYPTLRSIFMLYLKPCCLNYPCMYATLGSVVVDCFFPRSTPFIHNNLKHIPFALKYSITASLSTAMFVCLYAGWLLCDISDTVYLQCELI